MVDVSSSSPGVSPQKLTPAAQNVTPAGGTPDPYVMAFMVLLASMDTLQSTVLTQSKDLASNAKAQNKINNQAKNERFETIPSHAGQATIDAVQNFNERVEAQLGLYQSQQVTLRQSAQTLMAITNANVSKVQQDCSIDSGVSNMIYTISQQLVQMTAGG